VVEIVEGNPFDSVLAQRVFQPAGMSSATGETGEQLMANRARPYKLSAGATRVTVASAAYKDLSFLTGAGSVYATAEDLLHFVRALHDGKFGPVAAKLLGDAGDTTWTGIYGRINGYEGSIDYLPSQDLTLIFLSNLQSTANWQLREQFGNVLTGRTVVAIRNPPPVAPPFEDPRAVVGSYDDPPDAIVISEVDGRLFRDGDEVYPIVGGWYDEPVSGATMRFARASDGSVEEMITHYAGGRPDRRMKKLASGAR
jgi:CubicO group peptidase (beta-lactamase class C family)